MSATIHVAFWNVQNLFEPNVVERGPQSTDEYHSKIGNLAQALNGFFLNQGADLIGLAEVQSHSAMQLISDQLSGGPYIAIWENAGISTQTGLGVLARASVFNHLEIVAVQRPSLFARPRVLVVRCELRGRAEPFMFVVNHWKSRMPVPAGGMSDADDRLETADWLGQLLALEARNSSVLVIGDFNAEPQEAPFGELRLRGGRTFSSARWGGTPAYLYNTAWKYLTEPDSCEEANKDGYQESRPKSTHGEDAPSVFDHLLVSGSVLRGGMMMLIENELNYATVNGLTCRYKRTGKLIPYKWNYVSPGEYSGTSDHLPLTAKFTLN